MIAVDNADIVWAWLVGCASGTGLGLVLAAVYMAGRRSAERSSAGPTDPQETPDA